MSDNPKSLASLADDLEALAKRMQTGLPNAAADLCFRAAAALRAPTIAADRGIGFAFVLVKRFQELSSAAVLGSFEFNERGKAWLQEAFDYAAALATPSPTIAALEPLQLTESEAAELDAFRAKPSRAEGLTFTPVSTIAAPSPSNEVTAEMVEAGFAAQCEELPEFGNENRENMMRVARVTIEAALKARKPEDDGAGQ